MNMMVIRCYCSLAGVLTVACSAWSVAAAEPSPTASTTYWRGDAHVLRHKISVPLDQLVRPVRLSELTLIAVDAPAATAPVAQVTATHTPPASPEIEATGPELTSHSAEPLDDPFADDSESQPAGKIASGKLMGIVGRALLESAPMPSLEGLRKQMPALPVPGATDESPAAEAGSGSESGAMDDPFGEPRPEPGEAQDSEKTADPSADPFGGF